MHNKDKRQSSKCSLKVMLWKAEI